MLLGDLADIVLDHQGLANHLDVDRHRPAVVGRGGASRDVIRRAAAPIFSLRQGEQPIGDVYLFDRDVEDMAEGGRGERDVGQDFGHGAVVPVVKKGFVMRWHDSFHIAAFGHVQNGVAARNAFA